MAGRPLPHPRPVSRLLMPLAMLLVLASACGTQAVADAVRRQPKPAAPVIDWTSRTVDGALRSPWAIEFCAGEAPFLCVSRDGHRLGSLELLDWDLDDKTLQEWAADHLRWIVEDRQEGCGDGYEVVRDPVEPVLAAGRGGVRVSVTGVDAEGRAVERSVLHAWDHQGRRYLLAAHGHAEDSCLGRSFSDFTVADLRAFEPLLGEAVAAMKVEPSYAIG